MPHYNDAIRSSIVSYLQEEFPDFSIEEQAEEESYCFRLVNGSNKHFLRVMFTATNGFYAEKFHEQLDQFSVASTMRGLGDFPVVVTESGCMFGSP